MHGNIRKPIPKEQYEAYKRFIDDGQIEPHEVPALLGREPEFAAWLSERGARGSDRKPK